MYLDILPSDQREKKHPRAKRNSGGIIIYISHTVASGISKVCCRSNKGGDSIWVKLDKNYFSFTKDVFLCGGYLIPNADEDAFELLRKEVEYFSNLGSVSMIGDFNGRLSNLQPNY